VKDFDALFPQLNGRLVRLATRITGNAATAEEVAQEA
jgi:DNA-directed RNA polymerase specialized sigma24 family protein